LYGASKTPEDTEKALKNILPTPHVAGQDKVYRFVYAVHELLDPSNATEDANGQSTEPQSRFIGLINLRSLSAEECKEPPHDTHMSTDTTLSLEIAYMYLPTSWGHGYATESVSAVLDACARSPAMLWTPYDTVHVRAIVHHENGPSQKVMRKCTVDEPEVLEFAGDRFFIAGTWQSEHKLFVYGKKIVVGEKGGA
jgi:RimJ/RimL family protein N-acetyltransferase